MPDEVANPATPAPSPAPVAPAAPAAPPAGESFFARMERHGGFSPAPEPAAAEAPEVPAEPEASAAEAEPEAEKPKKGKKGKAKEAAKPAEAPPVVAETAQPTPEQKAEALRTLAQELGMTIEDGKVLTSDRAALRIAKRDADKRIAAQEADLVARYNKAVADISPELEKARAVIKALDDGDADELAKLSGAKDWNEAQERFIAKMTDPNWKEVRDLKRKLDEKERAEKEHQERLNQQSEHNKKLEAQRSWRKQLSEQMKQSKDPVCSTLAEDPAFVNAIFQIQQENWDGVTTVSPEQALSMAVNGAPVTIKEELQQMYGRLHKVFGQTVAAPATTAAQPAAEMPKPDKPGARPRPKTGVAPTATGGAPSPAGKMTPAERRAYVLRRLGEATAADRREAG